MALQDPPSTVTVDSNIGSTIAIVIRRHGHVTGLTEGANNHAAGAALADIPRAALRTKHCDIGLIVAVEIGSDRRVAELAKLDVHGLWRVDLPRPVKLPKNRRVHQAITIVVTRNGSVGRQAPVNYTPRLCAALKNVPGAFGIAVDNEVGFAVAVEIAGLRTVRVNAPERCGKGTIDTAKAVPGTCRRAEYRIIRLPVAVEIGGLSCPLSCPKSVRCFRSRSKYSDCCSRQRQCRTGRLRR